MKRTPIKKVSDKMKAQLAQEKELTKKLFLKQSGLCADCGCKLGWRSAKHEIISRAQGGNPLDEKNTILLCGTCHSKRHGIQEC